MGRIRSTFTETNIRLFSIIFLILLILGAVYWYFDQKRVVIKVGDRTVTKTEFNHKLAQYKKFISFTTKDNKDLKKTQLKTAAKDTAEKITEYLILKEEAEKRNISISSEEIDSELKYITQLYSSEDEYKKAIATAYDWTVDDTKQTIETRLLKKKLAPYILSYWSGTYVYMRYDVPLKEGMELIESDRIAKERMNSYYSRLQAGESFDKISEEAMSDPEYKYPNLWASYFKEISEEKSLSNQSEMEAITKLSQNGDSNVIKSEGGYYAIFKATEVGGGKYKSWDSFFDSYKKTNQVKEYITNIFEKFKKLAFSKIASLLNIQKAEAACDVCSGCKGAHVWGAVFDVNTGNWLPGATVELYTTATSGSQCTSLSSSEHGWCGPRSASQTASTGAYNFARVDGLGCFANCGWGGGAPWRLKASKSGYYDNITGDIYLTNGGDQNYNIGLRPEPCIGCNGGGALVKSADPASGRIVDVGNNINYTLRFNHSGSTLYNVLIIDTIPAGTTHISHDNVGSSNTFDGASVRWNFPEVGSNLELHITVRVNGGSSIMRNKFRMAWTLADGSTGGGESNEVVHGLPGTDVPGDGGGPGPGPCMVLPHYTNPYDGIYYHYLANPEKAEYGPSGTLQVNMHNTWDHLPQQFTFGDGSSGSDTEVGDGPSHTYVQGTSLGIGKWNPAKPPGSEWIWDKSDPMWTPNTFTVLMQERDTWQSCSFTFRIKGGDTLDGCSVFASPDDGSWTLANAYTPKRVNFSVGANDSKGHRWGYEFTNYGDNTSGTDSYHYYAPLNTTTYTATVKITDLEGTAAPITCSVTFTIDVSDDVICYSILASPGTSGIVPFTVTFTANVEDNKNQLLTYEWNGFDKDPEIDFSTADEDRNGNGVFDPGIDVKRNTATNTFTTSGIFSVSVRVYRTRFPDDPATTCMMTGAGSGSPDSPGGSTNIRVRYWWETIWREVAP